MVYVEYVSGRWLIREKYPALENHRGNMTDPIVDMLNRIRNAQAVLKETVSIPFSNLKYEIAKILEKNNFIKAIERKGRKPKKTITRKSAIYRVKPVIKITLKYKDEAPAISGLKRISKCGQRIYSSYKKIKRVKGGYGITIISTPKGLMIGKQAKKQKLGGEILCEIW